MGHRPKLGLYGKNWIIGQKNEILGPKKRNHFLILTMFWPRPEKVVQRKKVRSPKLSRGEMNGLSKGYKPPLTKIGVVRQKLDFLAKNRDFGPQKKDSLLKKHPVLATPGKECLKEKVGFSQINISLLRNFG